MPLSIAAAMLGAGIASGVGGVLSSALQFGSQAWSQKFNREEAEKAREFNALEAEKSRDFSSSEAALNRQFEAEQAELNRQWQTDMSNSAYQRSMSDMEKAGVNPNLLSGGALSASTGSSGVPQGSQAATSAASASPASSGIASFGNMFSGIANALNAYATLNNQKLIAQMYNDTSKANVLSTNNIRKYGFDRSATAYENVAFNNFYKEAKNREHFYEYLKAR